MEGGGTDGGPPPTLSGFLLQTSTNFCACHQITDVRHKSLNQLSSRVRHLTPPPLLRNSRMEVPIISKPATRYFSIKLLDSLLQMTVWPSLTAFKPKPTASSSVASIRFGTAAFSRLRLSWSMAPGK